MAIRQTAQQLNEQVIETDAGVVEVPKLSDHGRVNQEEVQAALEKVVEHVDGGYQHQHLGANAEDPDTTAQDDPYRSTWSSIVNLLVVFLIIVICVSVAVWVVR